MYIHTHGKATTAWLMDIFIQKWNLHKFYLMISFAQKCYRADIAEKYRKLDILFIIVYTQMMLLMYMSL